MNTTAKQSHQGLFLETQADDSGNLQGPTENRDTLKVAMEAAEAQIERSEEIRHQAEQELRANAILIEQQLAHGVAVELEPEGPTPPQPQTAEVETASTAQAVSRRLLELQRKQASNDEVLDQIRLSVAGLKEVADNAKLLKRFLAKTEHEITELEMVEAQHAKLQEMTRIMLGRMKELKSQNQKFCDQVELLKAQQNKNRLIIDGARAEVMRLKETNAGLQADISTKDVTIANLKDTVTSLQEKYSGVCDQRDEMVMDARKMRAALDEKAARIQALEKSLTLQENKIEALGRESEQRLIELKELHSLQKETSTKLTEANAKLEETAYALESHRTAAEETIRTKDARITKLEGRIEVQEKQIVISENMIADLNHEIDTLKKPAPVASAIRKAATRTPATRGPACADKAVGAAVLN